MPKVRKAEFPRLKRGACLTLVFLICLGFCGCWDYRGLNELIVVSGVAIDKNQESGDYMLSYEIMDLSANVKETGLKAKIVESTGRTLSEAVRNANKRIIHPLYFGHATVVIISQQIALEGEIDEILDWILRNSSVRETASIVVSVGQPAGDLLKLKGLDQSVVANEIGKILEENDIATSLTYNVRAYEAYNLLKAEGMSLVLPIFHTVINDDVMVVESDGLAVFKGPVMQGMLSPAESKCLLFLIDEMHGGLLVFELPNDENYFGLSILKSKTRISYEVSDDNQVTFTIKIQLNTSLSEKGMPADLLKKEVIENYQSLAEAQLKKEIEETVKRVQEEYATDVFGLGNYIHDTNNGQWMKLKDDWDAIFQTMVVTVEPEIRIMNTEYTKS